MQKLKVRGNASHTWGNPRATGCSGDCHPRMHRWRIAYEAAKVSDQPVECFDIEALIDRIEMLGGSANVAIDKSVVIQIVREYQGYTKPKAMTGTEEWNEDIRIKKSAQRRYDLLAEILGLIEKEVLHGKR